MGIVRWDPFRDLISIQDRMNKLFEERLGRSRFGDDDKLLGHTWTPAVDIYETQKDIVLQAELPGVKQEDIHLEIIDNTLKIHGERKHDSNISDENYHCLERGYGNFTRNFTLPTSIRQDEINASLKDGVLEIYLPKAESGATKEIKIAIKKED